MADHRRQRLLKQQIACIHMGTKNNRRIKGFGFEIHRMLSGGGECNLHIGETLLDFHQPRHQPAHGTGRRFQAHHGLLLTCLFCDHHHLVKRGHEFWIERAALRR